MRHLLLILSILLFSSPVIGQETGVLYLYESSSGIQWKTFGDGKVQPKYTGDIRNGKPDGFGILIWFDGIKYVGNFKDGKEHGQGTWTSPNGIKYEGEYKDGERNGQGTYTWSDGSKYVGEWKGDEMWNGTIYDKDGNIIKKVVNGKMINQ